MVIEGGYYIKARCIRDSFIAHASPCLRETFDYLLREANHADKKYNGFIVKRGQLFRTYQEIRDDLAWKVGYRIRRYSEDAMKHTMKVLTKQLMITRTKTPRGILITVCNYDFYQDPKNYEDTHEDTHEDLMNTQRTRSQPLSINKNVKKEKNIINTSNGYIPEKRVVEQETGMETKTVLPDWVPKETWDAFVEMRKKIKKPLTEHAKRLLIIKLGKLRGQGHDPDELLNNSIIGSYQGVFVSDDKKFKPENREGGNDGKGKRRYESGNTPGDTKYAGLGRKLTDNPDAEEKHPVHP